MSVKVMSFIFDLETLKPRDKFVALAYADHADHDGRNIWPAVETIAKKTAHSERTVQRATRSLEDMKLFLPDGKGPKGTNKWMIDLEWGDNVTPRQTDTGGVSESPPRGDGVTPEPSLPIIEPSQEDSPNGAEPNPEKEKYPSGEYIQALSDVTGLDMRIKGGMLAKHGETLFKAGYSVQDITATFGKGGTWYRKDWRGQKNQKPTLGQVGEQIKNLLPVSIEDVDSENEAKAARARAKVEAAKAKQNA